MTGKYSGNVWSVAGVGGAAAAAAAGSCITLLAPDWQQMMERARGSTLLWLSPTTPHRKSDPSFVINLLLLLLPSYKRILHQEEEGTYYFPPTISKVH